MTSVNLRRAMGVCVGVCVCVCVCVCVEPLMLVV